MPSATPGLDLLAVDGHGERDLRDGLDEGDRADRGAGLLGRSEPGWRSLAKLMVATVPPMTSAAATAAVRMVRVRMAESPLQAP